MSNSDDRQRAQELLPWLVNGSLSDADRLWLRDWLDAHSDDSSIHDELAWLTRTIHQVKTSVELPDAQPSLTTLLDRIRSEKIHTSSQQKNIRMTKEDSWYRSVQKYLSTPMFTLSMSVLLIMQAGLIGILWYKSEQSRLGTDSILVPLSGSQVLVSKNTILLQVTFVPDAQEQMIRQILTQIEAQIVAGPTALGVYTLAVQSANVEQVLHILATHQRVIESVGRL